MSALNNSLLLGAPAGATGYSISRSLRFNSSDSAYLSRTPASAGNRKTWTFSCWLKKCKNSSSEDIFSVSTGTEALRFDSDSVYYFADSGVVALMTTNAVLRDPSAWYHIILSVDTTQATASNRANIYINGVLQTLNLSQRPSLNYNTLLNNANALRIGGSNYLNGYLADIHFIDGQALDPTSFGEFSATTGVWMPKQYSGTYGTNGFHLDFADNSTAAALGTDTSGAGNTWTVNNISVAAGAGNDSLVDVPTNGSEVDTGSGGQVRGNYATWNPLIAGSGLSNGNLDLLNQTSQSTIGVASGKWYCEYTIINASLNYGPSWGFSNSSSSVYAGLRARAGFSASAGGVSVTLSGHSSDITSGTIGIALNLDANECKIYHNNQLRLTATGIPAGMYFFWHLADGAIDQINTNFGQRPFAYTAPSGFKALNTASLPAPLVTKPSTVMDVKLYTGNGSTQTISGLGFSPDLVWLKKRSGSEWHSLYDTIRGVEAYISTNTTNAEATANNTLTAFSSTGFTVGSQGLVNENGFTYAAWAWDAGSSTVTNTQGSITSQVRANASAGFSIVTYTGNGTSSQTVGHGLGVKPGLIIVKVRSISGYNWGVYHASLAGTQPLLLLNTTAAVTNSFPSFQPALNTSTVFGIGNEGTTNDPGATYAAYCFAPVAGYSSFGSYTGNGSADGPFVFCGFRPRWILIKASSSVSYGNWVLHDTARSSSNVSDKNLYANLSNSEDSTYSIDVLSNGFKLRSAAFDGTNGSGATYVYCAFAESPFAANNRAR